MSFFCRRSLFFSNEFSDRFSPMKWARRIKKEIFFYFPFFDNEILAWTYTRLSFIFFCSCSAEEKTAYPKLCSRKNSIQWNSFFVLLYWYDLFRFCRWIKFQSFQTLSNNICVILNNFWEFCYVWSVFCCDYKTLP